MSTDWPHGFGFCHCGCGQKTRIATHAFTARGVLKGQQTRYISGHNRPIDPTPEKDRFWVKVKMGSPDECWEWQAATDAYGYGIFNGQEDNRSHRVSYTLEYGPIPEGKCVLHRCDNPPCCNPSHLFLGSRRDNNQDRKAKNRNGDIKGEKHPRTKLTNDDVRAIRVLRNNGMTCREISKIFHVAELIISRCTSGSSFQSVD